MAEWCELRLEGCTGRATDRHHIRPRSAGGHDGPTMDICHVDHMWLHAHPAAAYANGWLAHALLPRVRNGNV